MCSEMKEIEDYGREQGIQLGIRMGIEQGIEKGIGQGILQGVEQGQRQAAEATILRMLEDHVPHDLIAKYNGVSIEEVEKLAYRDIA